jgi:NAD(P)-dependent dehydrogenase (short-subunit alcohol dehydrogenase family)
MRLSVRTAAVTGGVQDIGRALATRIAQEGANIVIADVRGWQPGCGKAGFAASRS